MIATIDVQQETIWILVHMLNVENHLSTVENLSEDLRRNQLKQLISEIRFKSYQ